MLIKVNRANEVLSSEITPEEIYIKRRDFMRGVGSASLVGASASLLPMNLLAEGQWDNIDKSPLSTDEKLNSFEDITQYNNFYELGTGKTDPAKHADELKTDNWKITVSGECENPGTYNLEDVLKPHTFEERIYRLRCVEAWSMVIPWVGISLADVLKVYKPTSKAKYVAFESILDPENLHGQRQNVLEWPYVEGLRIDEAMHPLTILAVGLYGKELLNQSGAPIRLVVPWKYGFKSIKSIVSIRFTETVPPTSWNKSSASEYGFYSNVNPNVKHPRWSQRKERRIGEIRKRKTLMFNGYDEVASLYSDLDLKKNF